MPRTVLVSGASGFIGAHLARELAAQGHDVRAMTRHPDDYDGAGTPVYADVGEPDSVRAAMEGCHAAYFLVHSLDSRDFEEKDAEAALNFGGAAADAGLDRIVYLGGLGVDDGDLSAHLRSRRQVEQLLPVAGVPVTVLRAAVVVGNGGISWEITRQLVDHLPVMVTPKWVKTRTQPIALRDVIGYLVGVLDHPDARGKVFEIGGPEVMRYLDMLKRAAKVKGKYLPSVDVPFLSPRLSSAWLALVTDVDLQTAQNLVDSMTNEVVVHDNSIRELFPEPLMNYDDAVRQALEDREKEQAAEQSRASGGGTQERSAGAARA